MSEAGTGDVEQRLARLEQQDQRLTQALAPLAQRDAPPAGKRRRDWDALAAVIASFIGLLALAVSGYTAYVQRQQLRAQVWPHLVVMYSNAGPELARSVINQGTGPARVIAMRVVMDDGTPASTWQDVKQRAGYADGEGLTTSWIDRAVIPAGKEIAFVKPSEDDRSRAKFRDLLPGGKHALAVTICYCSVLDDCWVTGDIDTGLDPDEVVPADRCPIKASQQFKE
jgi:hypothetical protein